MRVTRRTSNLSPPVLPQFEPQSVLFQLLGADDGQVVRPSNGDEGPQRSAIGVGNSTVTHSTSEAAVAGTQREFHVKLTTHRAEHCTPATKPYIVLSRAHPHHVYLCLPTTISW